MVFYYNQEPIKNPASSFSEKGPWSLLQYWEQGVLHCLFTKTLNGILSLYLKVMSGEMDPAEIRLIQ